MLLIWASVIMQAWFPMTQHFVAQTVGAYEASLRSEITAPAAGALIGAASHVSRPAMRRVNVNPIERAVYVR